MKKIIMSCAVIAALATTTNSFAQLQDEQNVTVTMDLQPILQLNMKGPSNLDFTFTTIPQYIGGIIKYGATQLTVSATVDWDLYAVGTSNNGTKWDILSGYNGGLDPLSTNSLPISLLELYQYPANASTTGFTGQDADYSTPFAPTSAPVPGQNSIYESTLTNAYTEPTAANKYIAGHAGATNYIAGGTYLTQTGATSSYKYTIDYRILPGLPATFPMAGTNALIAASEALDVTVPGTYARPGIYSMDVKYVLCENQ
jgi:hypothetical protein